MPTIFSFTKMIVADLERETGFYRDVIGLKEVTRITVGEGEDMLDEVILSADGSHGNGASLAIQKYRHRPAPPPGETVLGFVFDDVDAVAAAAVLAGGAIRHKPRAIPEHGVKVGFITDPEGHVVELMEMLAG